MSAPLIIAVLALTALSCYATYQDPDNTRIFFSGLNCGMCLILVINFISGQ